MTFLEQNMASFNRPRCGTVLTGGRFGALYKKNYGLGLYTNRILWLQGLYIGDLSFLSGLGGGGGGGGVLPRFSK